MEWHSVRQCCSFQLWNIFASLRIGILRIWPPSLIKSCRLLRRFVGNTLTLDGISFTFNYFQNRVKVFIYICQWRTRSVPEILSVSVKRNASLNLNILKFLYINRMHCGCHWYSTGTSYVLHHVIDVRITDVIRTSMTWSRYFSDNKS